MKPTFDQQYRHYEMVGWYNQKWVVDRFGNICILTLTGGFNVPTGTSAKSNEALPVGYRPVKNVARFIQSSAFVNDIIQLGADGKLSGWLSAGNRNDSAGQCIYVTNDSMPVS